MKKLIYKYFLYNLRIKNIIAFLFISFYYYLLINKLKLSSLKEDYHQIQTQLNLNFTNNINKKIRIGIHTVSLADGGLQRITAILINYLDKLNIFKIYLFSLKGKEKEEYPISDKVKRVFIEKKNDGKYLVNKIIKNKLDIFIYQIPLLNEIRALNNLKNVKVIFFIHSCFFYWLYISDFYTLKIYEEYKNSKYIISLIPFESDYLFKKWGINSLLFENFLTYNYSFLIASNLTSENILLIGRGRSETKRFELAIEAMEYITKEMSGAKLNIISRANNTDRLQYFINNLNLENSVKFRNYSSDPSIYFRDASLNLLTSISESYSLVLSETKMYGIPNILLGLDYLLLAKNGTIIIHDDLPETLAKVSMKVLYQRIYKKKLAKKARISMKIFDNENLIRKWKILLLSAYNNVDIKQINIERDIDNRKNVYRILKREVKLLNNRLEKYKNITIEDIENISFYNFAERLTKI